MCRGGGLACLEMQGLLVVEEIGKKATDPLMEPTPDGAPSDPRPRERLPAPRECDLGIVRGDHQARSAQA